MPPEPTPRRGQGERWMGGGLAEGAQEVREGRLGSGRAAGAARSLWPCRCPELRQGHPVRVGWYWGTLCKVIGSRAPRTRDMVPLLALLTPPSVEGGVLRRGAGHEGDRRAGFSNNGGKRRPPTREGTELGGGGTHLAQGPSHQRERIPPANPKGKRYVTINPAAETRSNRDEVGFGTWGAHNTLQLCRDSAVQQCFSARGGPGAWEPPAARGRSAAERSRIRVYLHTPHPVIFF